MSDWCISHDFAALRSEPATDVARRMHTAALFADHAWATVKLCQSLADNERWRIENALEAVCAELGRRIDVAQVKL